MSTKFFSATRLVCGALFFLLFAGATAHAADKTLKLEAQLVLGSNDAPTNGRPVSPQIEKKLKHLPLKWQHYSVVNAQQFSLAKNESKDVSLSGECQISVTSLGGERVKLTLMGNGQNVGNITQSLKKGHVLVAGGNEGNTIVVLRQMD
jgi:hypothetical protein